MKKYYLSAIVICFFSVTYGQNTFPANGNVGIGTTEPGAWFSNDVTQFAGVRPTIRLSPNYANGLGTILFKGAWSNAAGTADEFHLNYVSSLTTPSITLGSYLNGPTNVITFMGNGNVGIGTSTPDSKLSVNGKIRAQEIKVETANWPDYVFTPFYQLPTLEETEKHIKEKGHLPGIPSAEEVKSNGVDLGEMNAKLLQKIEELTLYLIERDKREKEQLFRSNEIIKKLSGRLEALENK